ncbi:response regulator transcription factor [Thermopolyspora sp. NPDC052614]|uniref:response regulator transcription factor n=1 Tax=Thermopolyspora sp. NPDC052614 TaxID=3155682 RepID=UPI00341C9137
MVRVFILAKVRLYREGLAQSLADRASISVVGSAAELDEALNKVEGLRPDILLLDLGVADGPPAARRIRGAAPGMKVVALAVSEDAQDIIRWAESGMSGYVTIDGTISDLVATVERAARGEVVCPPHVTACLMRRLADLSVGEAPQPVRSGVLTSREHEIADLIRQGLSNKEIARSLHIALPTVKNHVHNILRKLNVERRADMAAKLAAHL